MMTLVVPFCRHYENGFSRWGAVLDALIRDDTPQMDRR